MDITMNAARLLGTGILLMSILRCTGELENPSADSAITRDSLGIRVVYSDAPLLSHDSLLRLSDNPRIEIGGANSTISGVFFTKIATVLFADGQLIAAANSVGPPAIHIFNEDGLHLRTLGRQGQGPGEFRQIINMWLAPPDTLITYDVMQARVTYLTVVVL